MIDLHLHTRYSDGKGLIQDVLREAQQAGLAAISITDHDNVDVYEELKRPEIRSLFDGRIIPGIEVSAMQDGVIVHILGYGIDLDKVPGEINYITEASRLKFTADKLTEKLGVKIDGTDEFDPKSPSTFFPIYNQIMKLYPDFKCRNASELWWRHLPDPNCFLFIDYHEIYMTAEAAIAAIHRCGGKAVLAHPAKYQEFTDSIIDALKDKIDGIECYHSSASPQYTRELIDFCKEHGLIVTGGSDLHSHEGERPGSQNVPLELLEQFRE